MNTETWIQLLRNFLPISSVIGTDSKELEIFLKEYVPLATIRSVDECAVGSCEMVILASTDMAVLGNQAPVAIANALELLVPHGQLVVMTASASWNEATKLKQPGLYRREFVHLLAERGLEVERIVGVGAFARLANRPYEEDDVALDSSEGLAEAAPHMVAFARKWETSDERSRHFFRSLPLRTAAATIICEHPQTEAILLVFDTFKQSWTLPGGVVDNGESPLEGALRETREEAGMHVSITGLAGIFTDEHPDRLHFLYFAKPGPSLGRKEIEHPKTIHPHEIGEVRWVPFDEALDMLNDFMASRLAAVYAFPGATWPVPV